MPDDGGAQLQFVVVLSRHGVRSPTGDPVQYDAYSRAAWPKWDVPPGYLTDHGFEAMKRLGTYDRSLLAREGLLSASGCADADRVFFYADTDERTQQSGRALAQGMFPDCPPAVHGLAEGTHDPLFHPPHRQPDDSAPDPQGDPGEIDAAQTQLTEQYHAQIAQMDHILATCGNPPLPNHTRTSLFDVPTAPKAGKHAGELRGPLNTAASLSENFLLEYTQGLPLRDVGWGCISESALRSLIVLHTAAFNYEHRNPATARMAASNLLESIRAAMQQAMTGSRMPGAPDDPDDRALFLVGHDTNLASVAGLLRMNWTADGRRDDTPPGSALVFELWRGSGSGQYFVRVFYTTQTLDQMRTAAVLTPAHPPQRVALVVPGCSPSGKTGCSWDSFSRIVNQAMDPATAAAKSQ